MQPGMRIVLATVLLVILGSVNTSLMAVLPGGCESECGVFTQVDSGWTWNYDCNPDPAANECGFKQCFARANSCSGSFPVDYMNFGCGGAPDCAPSN